MIYKSNIKANIPVANEGWATIIALSAGDEDLHDR